MTKIETIHLCEQLEEIIYHTGLTNFNFELPSKFDFSMEQWPLNKKWTFDFFMENYGQEKIEVEKYQNGSIYQKEVLLKDYVSNILVNENKSPYNLIGWDFSKRCSELRNDYSSIILFDNWLDMFPLKYDQRLRWIYISPNFGEVPFHIDINATSAWNVLLTGAKLWLFIPESNMSCVDLNNTPIEQLVESDIEISHTIQRPGQLIYVPSGLIHKTISLEPSLALSENFINEKNYEAVIKALELKNNLPLAQVIHSFKFNKLLKNA